MRIELKGATESTHKHTHGEEIRPLSLSQAQQHNVPMLGLWISKSGSWASICCAGGRFLNRRAVLHKPQLLLTQLTSITHTTLPPARDWMLNMTYSILYGNEVIYSPPTWSKKKGAFRRGHLSDRLSSPGSQYSLSTVPGGSQWLNQPTNQPTHTEQHLQALPHTGLPSYREAFLACLFGTGSSHLVELSRCTFSPLLFDHLL